MEFGILFTSHSNVDVEPYPHRNVHARVTREIVRTYARVSVECVLNEGRATVSARSLSPQGRGSG